MTEVVIVREPRVVMTVVSPQTVVTAAQPGLPGPPDPDVLRVSNRLAEFDTPEARAAARAHLELQHIDCGIF